MRALLRLRARIRSRERIMVKEYKLSREEQETIIRGNAASHEWEVVTADPKQVRRMARQGYKPDPRTNPWGYVSFKVPYDRVRVMRAEKKKLSETQLAYLHQKGRKVPQTPQTIMPKHDNSSG